MALREIWNITIFQGNNLFILLILFVCIDLLNASTNHLWCIWIYFMWIDIMLYSWISVDLKNTIFKQNFRKCDYLISIFKMAVGYHDNIILAN